MKKNNQREYSPDIIVAVAEKLYEDSYLCNRYLRLLSELKDYRRKYEAEMIVSKSFYNTVYYALLESAFLKITKLFEIDNDNDSYTIGFLISHLKDIDTNNQYCYIKNKLFFDQIKLSDNVISYIKSNTHDIELKTIIKKISTEKPIVDFGDLLDVTDSEYSTLLKIRFSTETKIINDVYDLRCKYHVHNDQIIIDNKNPNRKTIEVKFDDLTRLCALALDVCIYYVWQLKNKILPTEPLVSNNYSYTLNLVRIGLQTTQIVQDNIH